MKDARRKFWLLAFEGDDTTGSGGGDDTLTGGNADDKKFSQKDVNGLLAKERRRLQTENQTLVTKLQELQSKVGTPEEKAELQTQIDNLQSKYMTDSEKAKQREADLLRQSKQEREALTAERDTWKTRFTSSTIERDITDAAAKAEAFNGQQIVALLRDKTQLAEELGEDGKPTGRLIPTVEWDDVDGDKKPVKLKITVSEAVERMKKKDDYLNLFKSTATGGIGGNGNKGNGKGKDPAKMSPAEYREWRKTNMK
jgi:hypothetical protein